MALCCAPVQADEEQRRHQERAQRLKAAEGEAANLGADVRRLEQQCALLEAELAEAHRERCSPLFMVYGKRAAPAHAVHQMAWQTGKKVMGGE